LLEKCEQKMKHMLLYNQTHLSDKLTIADISLHILNFIRKAQSAGYRRQAQDGPMAPRAGQLS
jgi:hypothetical protein